jgi:hypothetical protein
MGLCCALIGAVVFRAFSDAQAVGLVINVLDLATKSLLLTEALRQQNSLTGGVDAQI